MTAPPATARAGRAPYAAALGAMLCWASLAGALALSLEGVAPEQILFHGMLVAGLALAGADALRGRMPWHTWPGLRAAAWGLYGIFGYHALLVFAFSLAPRVPANVLNYTWPLWIIVLGAGRRLTRPVLLGGLLGLAGVALVVSGALPGSPSIDLAQHGAGLGLALGAGFCWGSFTVGLRRTNPQRGKSGPREGSPMAWYCLLAAAASGLLLMARGGSFAVAPAQWPLLAYIGLVPLGIAFALWDFAARRANLQVLGLLSYFTPPLSTGLLALVTGATLGWPLAAGLALILAGSAIGGRALRQ
jgi:drug/metabolite transporter (DMT)-like permease